jgi:predicted dithiol-disulfide oxidoreductase (DUF899 family)
MEKVCKQFMTAGILHTAGEVVDLSSVRNYKALIAYRFLEEGYKGIIHPCDFCTKKFDSVESLTAHTESTHSEFIKSVQPKKGVKKK